MQSSNYTSFLNPRGEVIEVKMITLKQYLNRQNPKGAVTVVKMDIEGMEFEVLESWDDEMFEKIGSLIIEIHLLNDEMQQQFELLKIRLITL